MERSMKNVLNLLGTEMGRIRELNMHTQSTNQTPKNDQQKQVTVTPSNDEKKKRNQFLIYCSKQKIFSLNL